MASLDALRARGAELADPVRFRFIEAMARRTAMQHGEARRILDRRLEQLLASFGSGLDATSPPMPPSPAARRPPGALAELVARVAEQSPPAREPKALAYFRSIWSKLSADRRLTQSLEKAPENPGPLNSHHLVHRSLTLMREVSPDYLNHFMSYVDTLLWIDQANTAAAAATPPARTEGGRKGTRGRAG